MGYTHYWRRNPDIDPAAWAQAIADCEKIIEATAEPFELDVSSDGNQIWFNGNAARGQDHEDFVVPRHPSDLEGFAFCKTACKPYDTIVVACLARLAEAGLVVSSDGGAADWEDGIKVAADVLGRQLACPTFTE